MLNVYTCERIETSFCDSIEFVAVKVKLTKKFLFITCSYVPPNSSSNVYDGHLIAINSILQLAKPSDIFVVLEDFNLPNLL